MKRRMERKSERYRGKEKSRGGKDIVKKVKRNINKWLPTFITSLNNFYNSLNSS